MRVSCFVLLGALFVVNSTIGQLRAEEYSAASWQQWRTDYDEAVAGNGGWLSLAGLFWLTPGINTLGSGPQNTHIFPTETPISIGEIELQNQKLFFRAKNDEVLINEFPAKSAEISVHPKSTIAFGNFEFHVIQREERFAVRLIDNQNSNVKLFSGTHFIPFDRNWILDARLVSNQASSKISMATVYGVTREEDSAGWLEFKVNGVTQRLEAVSYGKDYPLYLIFSDSSNGETTYSAGRYIEVEWPNKKGNTRIDFNRAYNPPCTYTNFATCPLTPRQNRLKVAIDAGELDNDFLKKLTQIKN